MRKVLALVSAHKDEDKVYVPEQLVFITKDFHEIDFTTTVKERRYYTINKMFSDIMKIAKANGFKIEVAGEANKIPDIMFSNGGKYSKYVFSIDKS